MAHLRRGNGECPVLSAGLSSAGGGGLRWRSTASQYSLSATTYTTADSSTIHMGAPPDHHGECRRKNAECRNGPKATVKAPASHQRAASGLATCVPLSSPQATPPQYPSSLRVVAKSAGSGAGVGLTVLAAYATRFSTKRSAAGCLSRLPTRLKVFSTILPAPSG